MTVGEIVGISLDPDSESSQRGVVPEHLRNFKVKRKCKKITSHTIDRSIIASLL